MEFPARRRKDTVAQLQGDVGVNPKYRSHAASISGVSITQCRTASFPKPPANKLTDDLGYLLCVSPLDVLVIHIVPLAQCGVDCVIIIHCMIHLEPPLERKRLSAEVVLHLRG